MKGTIGLEFIGCNTADLLRRFSALERLAGVGVGEALPKLGPLVASVGVGPQGAIRLSPLSGRRDYSGANSKGSRGVYMWYTLDQNVLYYIRDPRSWRHTEEYFAAITSSGDVCRLSDSEVKEWLSGL